MYVQDFEHLKISFEDLANILNKSHCSEWAYIVHDKDTDNNNEAVRKHIHVVLKYSNPQVLEHVARLFKDKPQYLQVWKGRINNAYSYLIHETTESGNKYRYDPKEVKASFDFNQKIGQIRKSFKQPSHNRLIVDSFLDQYAAGDISFDELQQGIGTVQVAKKRQVIDQIDRIKEQNYHKQWLIEFFGQRMETHWIWGQAGVGKTRYAKWLCRDDNVAILGSSRDYFQEYHGERVVILNDLRPNDFQYGDLLRLLDPYEHNKMAPRRYHDVPLNIEVMYITSPYSPQEFYQKCKIDNPEVDTFEQLNRRVHSIHVTKEFIKEVFPDETEDFAEWKGIAR